MLFFNSLLDHMHSALIRQSSNIYVGGDLENKGRYRDFMELFVLGHSRDNEKTPLSVLGKLRRNLNLMSCDSGALLRLKNILQSETEKEAILKIHDQYGHDLKRISELNLSDIVLHEYAFLELGLFMHASMCHVFVLKAQSRNSTTKRSEINKRLKAQIELDTLQLNGKKRTPYLSTQDKDLRFYSSLVNGSSVNCSDRYSISQDINTLNFYKSVRNSKVLIIGPRPTMDEIDDSDEFDIIVIMNYHGPVRQRDEILKQLLDRRKTAIASYYGNNASELLSDPRKTVSWEFKPSFIVIKSNIFQFQRQMFETQHARILNTVDNILALGSGNFLQQCLYDVLCFEPEMIKIIGLDFWVGSTLYDEDYKINKSDETFARYSFAAHNVFSNWLFPKALKQAGLLECSGVVAGALDLDYFDYAKALSKKYPFKKVV